MSRGELFMCLVAVLCSSSAQLCIKGASNRLLSIRGFALFGLAGALMVTSMAVAVYVLHTVSLSQLVPFAATAYILVPLGGRIFFQEELLPRFWFGVLAILTGIIFASI